MNQAVIGIGSNIDPVENTAEAITALAEGQRLLARSRFVWTKPIGPPQPAYLNGAVLIETPLDRDALKAWLRGVEDRLGRVRSAERFGPRTIDLDVVVWNGQVVDEDVRTRAFLRQAVSEVWPPARSAAACAAGAP